MSYLDTARLQALNSAAFQGKSPYPWVNPQGLLSAGGFRELTDALPDIDQFERVFGKRRAHGQQSHDRYTLAYHKGLDLAPSWRHFIAELEGDGYQAFIRRLFGRGGFRLRYHWHYTPAGCSVSPHCDGRDKLGSHIFYFNTADDWQAAWGGETVVLDDGGRFKRSSAPAFENFDRAISAETMDNHSFIFARQGDSWHGVREITCPEGHLRKVFIVVVEDRILGLKRRVMEGLHLRRRQAVAS
ncbi:MAG: hypothetical protein VYA71_04700 [Pseudomonadota bacterium]|nr:hypothetical protein [Pseudomonadota bacterium]